MKLLKLYMRNFLSYGNKKSGLDLTFTKPTLITGINHDSSIGGQTDSNGAGKTTILNAIAFCLYDKTISKIEKNNLINFINKKNLEVTIDFEHDSKYYRIIRFRKCKELGGDGVKILVSDTECFSNFEDKTPDSISNSNAAIEKLIGLPFEIFSRLVVFSASYDPFLNLPKTSTTNKANQTSIIEELFGYTEIAEKAEKLRSNLNENKKELTYLKKLYEASKTSEASISDRLVSTLEISDKWEDDKKNNIKILNSAIDSFNEKVINNEIKKCQDNETDNAVYNKSLSELSQQKLKLKNELTTLNSALSNFENWELNHGQEIETLKHKIKLSKVYENIENLINSKNNLKELKSSINQIEGNIKNYDLKKSNMFKEKDEIEKSIDQLKSNKCPTCKQHYNDNKQVLNEFIVKLANIEQEIDNILDETKKCNSQINTLQNDYDRTVKDIENSYPGIKDDSIESLKLKSKHYNDLIITLKNKENETNPYKSSIDLNSQKVAEGLNSQIIELEEKISKLVENIEEIKHSKYNQSYKIDLIKEIEQFNFAKNNIQNEKEKQNPYISIVLGLNSDLDKASETTKELSDKINSIEKTVTHEDFLLKLLTKKESFIRQALLNKRLPYLNERLSYYLDKMGLPHSVRFNNNLEVEVSQFSTKIEHENLSTGQKARINLALAFAFRDVLQQRFNSINFCVLDECLDVGLGNTGVQLAAKMIKRIATENKLSMFVISHRDEISTMFDSQLLVELKNGFSEFTKGDMILDPVS